MLGGEFCRVKNGFGELKKARQRRQARFGELEKRVDPTEIT